MDSEYIKMCKEAKEIQELWKEEPTEGDRVLAVKKIVTGYQDIITFVKGHPNHWRIGTVESRIKGMLPQELNQDDFFWLPRQEDLQNIILDGFKGEDENYKPTPIMVLKTFARDFVNQFGNDLDDRRSLNELWLIFVMELVYNKRWNGETWEPIGE